MTLSERLGVRLLAEVSTAASLSPRLTPPKCAAYLLAVLVHLSTVAVAVGGVLLIWGGAPSPVLIFFGLFMLLIAYELRPRVPKLRAKPLAPEQMPALRGLVARVAQEIGAPALDSIVITSDWSAATARTGWKRRRVLFLGLPLLLALDTQERTALLGHELGHNVNGDANRGLVIGTALSSLGTWSFFLHSHSLRNRSTFDAFGLIVLEGFSYLPRGVLKALRYLNWHESQRAEYLADHLAARTGGTEAAISMLAKLGRGGVYQQVVQRRALNREGTDLFAEARAAVAVAAANAQGGPPDPAPGYRLDSTHPPGEYRIRFLRARAAELPHCIPAAAQAEQLEQELLRPAAGVQQHVLERYRRSLYR